LQSDVELRDPGLVLLESGSIAGQLSYTGPTEGDLAGQMALPPIYHTTRPQAIGGTPVEKSARSIGKYLESGLHAFVALMFVAIVCVLIIPRQIQSPMRELQAHPISALGVGMLSFILSFPIVLLLAIISFVLFVLLLIRLPIGDVSLFGGIVLGLANIGAASVFYFTAVYISRVVVGLAIGRLLMRALRLRPHSGRMRSMFIEVGIGLSLLAMLGALPIVGNLFTAITLFSGLGAILSVVRVQIRRLRESGNHHLPLPLVPYKAKRPALAYYAMDAAQLDTPVAGELPGVTGMGDLPDGFNWWGEDK